jgi:hypothetical protein
MDKGDVKLVIFNGENFGYWKNRTHNYLLSQGRAIWDIVQEAYVSPDTWTVHISSVVVHVPLVQMVRCKRL